MSRLFEEHLLNKPVCLDGIWRFITDRESIGADLGYMNGLPDEAVPMPVPSCWNLTLGYFGYEGTAWYETCFKATTGTVHLKFEGVSNECDVYVDGILKGSHYGAFVEFGFTVTDLLPGQHRLTVCVNNNVNMKTTLPNSITDWYNYGGINRSVYLYEIEDVIIYDCRIDYTLDVRDRSALMRARLSLYSTCAYTDELVLYLGQKEIWRKRADLGVGACEIVTDEISLTELELWDVYKPNLYYIRAVIGNADIIDRIGFRLIEVSGKDILINGRPVTLLGINRHEEHPDWGFSMPFELIKRDIDIIRGMNCNAVRASHYSNTKKTLDYCDEIGLLFWEEIPMWGFTPGRHAALSEPTFIKRAENMHREMIARDKNHPCIIIWGLHNEIANELPEGRAITERLASLVRSLDPTRLITYASMSCHLGKSPDLGFDLVDIVSLNYYIGWYNSFDSESFADMARRMRTTLSEMGIGDKPVIMSEFGAGAVRGETSLEAPRWTENYQAELLDRAICEYLDSGEISGSYVWQFADIRSNPRNELTRPRSFNNKGVLDEYRRPKLGYETVKRLYARYNPDSDEKTIIKLR